MHEFRWRSQIGVSAGLFLFYGIASVGGSIYIPLSLHFNGLTEAPFLVLGGNADSAFLARPLETLQQQDPRLAMFLINFMDTMCAYMASFGLLQLGIAWFALRGGRPWALWTLLVANLAIFPYYFVVASSYVQLGISVADPVMIGFFVGTLAIVVAATALGWLAPRPRPRDGGA